MCVCVCTVCVHCVYLGMLSFKYTTFLCGSTGNALITSLRECEFSHCVSHARRPDRMCFVGVSVHAALQLFQSQRIFVNM